MDARYQPPEPTEPIPELVESEAPPMPEPPPPVDEGVRPGLVPPPGALPRSFGPRPGVIWFVRVAVVSAAIWAIYWTLTDLVHDLGGALSIVDIIGPALLVGYFLARRLVRFRRHSGGKGDAIVAAAVHVEPAGLKVMSWLWDHRFSWGELVGITEGRSASGGYALRALRGSKRVEILLPPGGWGRRLARILSGHAEHEES